MNPHAHEKGESHLVTSRSWDGNDGWGRTTLFERRVVSVIGFAWVLVLLLGAVCLLSGCMTAAEREASDDAACTTARDYTICRENIMSHRRDNAIRSQ